jgi:hypothetical protein
VEKIWSALPPGMKALLDQCVARGLYGDPAMTVRHFVTLGLEQLVVDGRLIDIASVPKPPAAEGEQHGEEGKGSTG